MVIHIAKYAGTGGIFLGLVVIDGRVLRWLMTCLSFRDRPGIQEI